jgi:hypothetical protein
VAADCYNSMHVLVQCSALIHSVARQVVTPLHRVSPGHRHRGPARHPLGVCLDPDALPPACVAGHWRGADGRHGGRQAGGEELAGPAAVLHMLKLHFMEQVGQAAGVLPGNCCSMRVQQGIQRPVECVPVTRSAHAHACHAGSTSAATSWLEAMAQHTTDLARRHCLSAVQRGGMQRITYAIMDPLPCEPQATLTLVVARPL